MKVTLLLLSSALLANAGWQAVQKDDVGCAGCLRGSGVTGALDDDGQEFCQAIYDSCGTDSEDADGYIVHDANIIVTWAPRDGSDINNCPSSVDQCKSTFSSVMGGCTGMDRAREAVILRDDGDEAGGFSIVGQCFCLEAGLCG